MGEIQLTDLNFDCRQFKGGIPCEPNKLRNKICKGCDEYDKIETRVLIIKLGALGDVIRTTPLLTRFRKEFPSIHFTWITLSPDILPKSEIDEIYKFDFESTYIIRHQQYDIALNLDKSPLKIVGFKGNIHLPNIKSLSLMILTRLIFCLID